MSYIINEWLDELEPENHKFTAREWHLKYKFEAFKMFNFTCAGCLKDELRLREGVVHHKTYLHKGGIYQARPYEIKDKICVLCHECHLSVHQSERIDGVTKLLPTITKDEPNICEDCGWESHEIDDMGLCEVCRNRINNDYSEYIF